MGLGKLGIDLRHFSTLVGRAWDGWVRNLMHAPLLSEADSVMRQILQSDPSEEHRYIAQASQATANTILDRRRMPVARRSVEGGIGLV